MPVSRSDQLWLDEYTKRKVMSRIYGASSMATSWTLYMKLTEAFLQKMNGEKADYHPKRTPALAMGLSVVGVVLSGLLMDQVAAIQRLEAKRLAKRIGLNDQTIKSEEATYQNLPNKTPWLHVLKPGGFSLPMTREKPSPEERQFERTWYRKHWTRAMIGDQWGGAAYGVLYAIFPFALRKLIAKGNGENPAYRHPQTTLIMAGLLIAGYISQFQLAKYSSERILLEDNYEAREIAKRKGTLHEGVSSLSALFTGEKTKENNPFLEYDRKWLKKYTRARATWFRTANLTNTIFYGAISVIGSMVLEKASGKDVKYRPMQSTAILASALAIGGVSSYINSLAEANVKKQEDDRLAIRVTGQRPDAQGNVKEPKSQQDKKKTHFWQQKMAAESKNRNMPQDTDKKEKKQPILNDNLAPPEDFKAYDAAWLKRFQQLSFRKGLYEALASATFFGLFGTLTGMALKKVADPKAKIDFDSKRSPYAMGGLASIGAWFAYQANKQESLLRKLEDDRLAHRVVASQEQKDQQDNAQSAVEEPNRWRNRIETQEKEKVSVFR